MTKNARHYKRNNKNSKLKIFKIWINYLFLNVISYFCYEINRVKFNYESKKT